MFGLKYVKKLVPLGRVKIRSFERGFHFRDREFKGMLGTGVYWFLNPFAKHEVIVSSQRDVIFEHKDLDAITRAKVLGGESRVLDLKDCERAIVWVDGRFERILGPGLHLLWTAYRDVRVEIAETNRLRFEHERLDVLLATEEVRNWFEEFTVREGHTGLTYHDGKLVETLPPGRYAFWKNAGSVRFQEIDRREAVLDISGQDIMTADKVTLRLNAVVTFRIADVEKSVTEAEDVCLSLYREAQLVLRGAIGTRDLDALLSDKEGVARELGDLLKSKCEALGVRLVGLGIRDVILPGEMKDLLNRVTEAKKAAEANLISRREETAAMRSQANTARLLENNTTLMRLRELEVLEKIAASSKMQVVLGEKGLADRVVNLL